MADEGPDFSVRLLWIDLDETPVYAVNQLIGQIDQDDIILSLGFANPPVIIGDTPEERREQAEHISYVAVRPVVRLSLTRRRLDDILTLLMGTRDNYDKLHGEGGPLAP